VTLGLIALGAGIAIAGIGIGNGLARIADGCRPLVVELATFVKHRRRAIDRREVEAAQRARRAEARARHDEQAS